jgi:Spy/CpxP family protein refolding chaperone
VLVLDYRRLGLVPSPWCGPWQHNRRRRQRERCGWLMLGPQGSALACRISSPSGRKSHRRAADDNRALAGIQGRYGPQRLGICLHRSTLVPRAASRPISNARAMARWLASRGRPHAKRQPPGPRPTLGQPQRSHCWTWVYYQKCLHHAPMALVPLIIRWGADTSSDRLRQRARCTKCGHKGATLQSRTGCQIVPRFRTRRAVDHADQRAACRFLPPALLHRLIVLAGARARVGRLGVPIALGKEAEAVVAPVVARNGDTDRRPAHQEAALGLVAQQTEYWRHSLRRHLSNRACMCNLPLQCVLRQPQICSLRHNSCLRIHACSSPHSVHSAARRRVANVPKCWGMVILRTGFCAELGWGAIGPVRHHAKTRRPAPRKRGRTIVRSAILILFAILAFATTPARAQSTWFEMTMIRAICGSKTTPADNTDRLAKRLNLTDAQKAALKELSDASASADSSAKASLCADKPDLSTTPGRMAFAKKMAETRLAAMKAVEPKFQAFYDSLDAKQKNAFDTGGRIGGILTGWARNKGRDFLGLG